jgi:hypothetical protein
MTAIRYPDCPANFFSFDLQVYRMAQPRGFAGMFGNAVAKLTDIRPISTEDVGMGESNRSGGGKANRISRRERKNQAAKGPLRAIPKAIEDVEMKGTVPTGRGKL